MKLSIHIKAGPWAVSAQMKRAIARKTGVIGRRPAVLKKQPQIRFVNAPNYAAAEKELLIHLRRLKPRQDCPMTGPLRVRIDLSFPYLKAERAAIRKAGLVVPHTARPDLDNLSKLYLDCLVKAGIIEDDSLVAELTLTKYRTAPDEVGVQYQIETIDP